MATEEFLVDEAVSSSSRSFAVPKSIRWSIKSLQAVSSTLATKMALNLFFKPIPFPVPEREKNIRESATRRILSTGKADFELFEWGSGERKILLMHGWSGRCTQFFKLIEQLTEQGFHVFGIDAPAHGDSEDKRTHMLEFSKAMKVTEEKFGSFDCAIGHSMGGMAIFNAIRIHDLKTQRVIIVGTPANITNVVTDFCNRLGANHKVAQGIIKYIEQRYSLTTKQASTDYLSAYYNPEGLIIHDTEDRDVPYENARITEKRWPAARLISTRGLGHRKILMNAKVNQAIVDFLK